MFTTDLEASTLDKYQIPTLLQIEHRGYCYFPFQENPQISTQSSGIFWANQIPEKYLCIVEGDTCRTIPYITPYFNQNAPLILPVEPSYGQINLLAGTYYIIQTLIQEDYFDESFDAVSTDKPQVIKVDSHIEQIILNLFKSYGHEEFDSDIAYYFTNDLEQSILDYGKPALIIIGNIISREILNHNLVNEILKALGRIEDTETNNIRFDLLIRLLKNVSATIRDGAVSGLSFLDDKRALPQLRILYELETAPILKGNIQVAIENLEL